MTNLHNAAFDAFFDRQATHVRQIYECPALTDEDIDAFTDADVPRLVQLHQTASTEGASVRAQALQRMIDASTLSTNHNEDEDGLDVK